MVRLTSQRSIHSRAQVDIFVSILNYVANIALRELPLVMRSRIPLSLRSWPFLSISDERVINEVDALGRDAMMYAVHGSTEGHARCLELLLDCGCDVNHQANGMHQSALCSSIKEGGDGGGDMSKLVTVSTDMLASIITQEAILQYFGSLQNVSVNGSIERRS